MSPCFSIFILLRKVVSSSFDGPLSVSSLVYCTWQTLEVDLFVRDVTWSSKSDQHADLQSIRFDFLKSFLHNLIDSSFTHEYSGRQFMIRIKSSQSLSASDGSNFLLSSATFFVISYVALCALCSASIKVSAEVCDLNPCGGLIAESFRPLRAFQRRSRPELACFHEFNAPPAQNFDWPIHWIGA